MPKKLTIELMQEIAGKKGGLCLSVNYINNSIPLEFQCQKGHKWKARPDKIIQGQWCPVFPCNIYVKGSLDRMQELAAKIDKYGKGKCLSTQYIDSNTELLWQCGDKTHPPFSKKPTYVSSGHWCIKCGGSEKGTIEKARLLAKTKRGKCLSTVYKNARTPLEWECEKGHRFFKSYNKVQSSNSWCKNKLCCKRPDVTIEDMHQLAAIYEDGKCLSKIYINDSTKLLWQCKEDHQWWATPNSVKSNKWCKICVGKDKGTIEEMQQIALERMGKYLSTIYVNTETKLEWQCYRGHKWDATPHSVKNNKTWCPECATNNSKGEEICRSFFEQLFHAGFNRVKPTWLFNNRKNGKLQLDGYNEKLKLSFEHQGFQHYKFIKNKFHKTNDAFLLGQENDKLKAKLCKKNNVTLIVVPEIPTKVKIEDLKIFIRQECLKSGYPIPEDFDKIEIQPPNLYDEGEKKLKELQEYSAKKGGKCLSDKFLGMRIPLKFQCALGHEWPASPNRILHRNTWCPNAKCGGTGKKTLKEIQDFADARNLKLLSENYIRARNILKWECKSCGYSFEKSYFKVYSSKNSCRSCFLNNRKLGNVEEIILNMQPEKKSVINSEQANK